MSFKLRAITRRRGLSEMQCRGRVQNLGVAPAFYKDWVSVEVRGFGLGVVRVAWSRP